MTKAEFLLQLENCLKGLPQKDIDERLSFYSEMIDDKIEDGLSEEAAVKEMGKVESITEQSIVNTHFKKIIKESFSPKAKLKVWEIVLLIVGSPLWVSLLLTIIALIFAIYVVLWVAIALIWVIFATFVGCGVAGIIASVIFVLKVNPLIAAATFNVSLVCIGISIILLLFGTDACKRILQLTKKINVFIKNIFIKKEERQW